MKKLLFILIAFIFNTAELYAVWESNTKIAVIDLAISSNITELDPKAISEILQSELVKQNAFPVLERGQIKKVIDEEKLELSGFTESEKASRLGALLGADEIITGSISMMGKNYYIVIKAINAKSGVVEYSEEGSAEFQEYIPAVLHGLADNLIAEARGKEKSPGTVTVYGPEESYNKLNLMVLNRQFLIKDNIPVMQGYSKQISTVERDYLYQKNQCGWILPMVGNYFIPSLGSFLQGDYTGGTIICIGFWGSIVTLGVAASNGAETLCDVMAVICLSSYIYNIAEPVLFAGDWNFKLKSSLIISMDEGPGASYAYAKYPPGIRLDLKLFEERF